MFEGVVASLLNKYLGKYIQDLDTDNLNVGIFGGEVELRDLQLRPEALFELDLPIEVKAGTVGRIHLTIPWTNIYTTPVSARLEDVYVVAGPVTDRAYDSAREDALKEARKRAKLAELENIGTTVPEEETPQNQSFTEKLIATVVNNIQVVIERIHIRYEDKITNPDQPFACGIMLKSLTAQSTNSQWQISQIDAADLLIHKLAKLHGLSIYWNPFLPKTNLIQTKLHLASWKDMLKNAINTHKIMDEELDFILRPVAANTKMIFNKEEESVLPKLSVDFAFADIETVISRQQFLNVLMLADSLKMMDLNQQYRKYHPGVLFTGHVRQWWHYAYNAVVGEYIRPFSWARIKEHRRKYRAYKDLYKQQLRKPSSNANRDRLYAFEKQLDVTNILLAREHAKLEFAKEAPNKVKRKKNDRGWWSWMWSGDPGESPVSDPGDGEVIIPRASSLPEWLDNLSKDQREKLFKNIGYDENMNVEHAPQYVARKVNMNIKSFTVCLVNYGKEILKTTVTQVQSNLEYRPDTEGIRVTLRTETFMVEGVSVEHDLVPVITSDIGVYAPSITNQVFSIELEKSPVHVQADYAVTLKVQPVEIVYDENAVTEVIAFFQVPNINAEDVRSMAKAGWDRIASISRAGLQHAILQHKTVSLSAHMKSPYVVIPEYGSLHRGGSVLVVDFGKLKVESELQPKNIKLDDLTMSEVESRMYDKFNITVTDVKALLADSGDDWHTAQTKQDSEYHILPSFGMTLSFFNTVQPEFTQLPRHKIEARLSTVKFHLSDEKILMLSDFSKHMPMPYSSSMMGLEDSVDGHIDPVLPAMNEKEAKLEPSLQELKNIRRSVYRNSAKPKKPGAVFRENRDHPLSSDSVDGHVASEPFDEELEDISAGLDIPALDDHRSMSNLTTVLSRLTLGEVMIQISKCADRIDTPYLMLRVNRLCADMAITTYGMGLHATLGSVQLVDKIHMGSSGEYMEMFGSKSESDLITVMYRHVSPNCPEFHTIYKSKEQAIMLELSSIHVNFDRTAVLYLNTFIQGLLLNVRSGFGDHIMRRSTSTVLSGALAAPPHPAPPSFVDRLTSTEPGTAPGLTKLHLLAKMSDLDIKLTDRDTEFAKFQVKGLEMCMLMKAGKSMVQARLTDLVVEDLTENTLYSKVLTIEDDNAFDFKMITFSDAAKKLGTEKKTSVDGSIKLRLGRAHGVFLYKFMSEISNFLNPFTNPELIDTYKMAARQAVHNKIQDIQEQGTRIGLFLDIKAPTILVPQHSESTNVVVIKLGDFTLKNFFEDSEIGGGVLQHWDHMYFGLDSVEVFRGKLNLNGNVEHCHTIVEPISFHTDMKRALPPYHSDLHYDIYGEFKSVKIQLTEVDLKVLMAITRENLREVSDRPEKVDECDMTPMSERPILPQESLDTTTPIVEIEEPLLAAPEVLELVRQTKAQVVMEGVVVTLVTQGVRHEEEDDDEEEDVSPVSTRSKPGDVEGLARFEMGQLAVCGTLSSEGDIHVQCTLQSVTMVDVRPNSPLAIKKMMQSTRPGIATADSPPIVFIEYQYKSDGNKQVDINIETLRIHLCMEYILMVQQFFLRALQRPEESHMADVKPQSPSGPPPPFPGGSGRLSPIGVGVGANSAKIQGTFKSLEIILFAEPEKKNSRVLVLQVNGTCDYFCLQERKHMEAKVKQLQIVSCLYGLRNSTASVVLHPCDIDFVKDHENPTSDVKMDLKMSEIILHLSASNLAIMLDVLALIRTNQPEPVPTHDAALGDATHYDLWTTKSMSLESWIQPEPDLNDEDDHFPGHHTDEPREMLSIDIKKVEVMFEVENLDYHVPRLSLRAAVEAEIQDWNKQLCAQGEIRLEASYYNERLAVWEPLIEPVLEKEGNYRPWEVLIKCVRSASHPISCIEIDTNLTRYDELDGDVHSLLSRAKANSDTSETETDSDTDMTVIKPKPVHKTRHGSHSSYEKESGFDETDAPYEDDTADTCMYWLIDSHDSLQINLTPTAIDLITEVTETFLRKNSSTLKSIHDLPGFEIYNQLDIPAAASVSHDLQIYKENLHNIELATNTTSRPPDEVESTATLVDIDTDEDSVDGLSLLSRALASSAHILVSSAAFHLGDEEEDDLYASNRELGKQKMHIKLGNFDEIYNVSHRKAVTRLIPLSPCRNDTNYSIVYDVEIQHGRKIVTMRSPLKLANSLTIPVDVYVKISDLSQYSNTEVYQKCARDPQYCLVTTVQPGDIYNIPMFIAYHCKLYLAPTDLSYDRTTHPVWWQDLSTTKDKYRFFACLPQSQQQQKPFFFKVVCGEGNVTVKSSKLPKVVPHFVLHLYPPVTLHNLLPYDLQYSLHGSESETLPHGENIPMYNADLGATPKLQFKIADYLGTDWSGTCDLTFDLEEFKAITMESETNVEGQNKQLSLGIHVSRTHLLDLYIYSPYWIVNKTGLPVQLRGSRTDAVYENDSSEEPLMFRFKKHKRKKAKIRVYNSKWTKSFSLDTVGSNGVVVCHDRERNRKFQFLLQIQMSKLHLTKIVTLMPYFLVINNTPKALRYMEENEEADLWMDANPQECVPFWPSTDSMRLHVKYHDSKVASQHFYIHRPHTTTLRMDKGTALCVEVSGGTESPITITFLPYEHGDAPVRVENLCEDVFLKLHQKNQSQVSLLSPCQSVLYTWDDPTAEHTLMWNVYNRKKPSYPAFITKDDAGEVQLSIQTVRRSSMLRGGSKPSAPPPAPPPKHAESSDDDDSESEAAPPPLPMLRRTRTDKVVVYWVSYLDGLQRVLLFTQDQRVARKAKQRMQAEQANMAAFLSLGGVSLSLMNAAAEEVALLTLSSGAALWEVEVKNKWKTLNMELASLLEEKWLKGEERVALEEYLEANIERMEMKKPFIGALRRVYDPALWLQYRQSVHHTYLHMKVHRVQVDNQLKDAYFPTVFAPTPLPSYILKKSSPKPLMELALMRRQIPEHNIDTFRYVKLLVQEFSLRIDKGFVLSVYDILASRQQKKLESEQLQDDLTQIHRSLQDMISLPTTNRTKRIVFEYLHLSPLKMQISFSLNGRVHRAQEVIEESFSSDLINFFLNSVGASLTEIRDVEIRMAYFERQGVLMSPNRLFQEVKSHYTAQAVQQAYVFVLGMDVLGNPYGLIKDFTQGLGDFFYEPFLSTIHSPDKFADHLVKGVHSLMEHTVGSTAGSLSLITGSLGRTLAALSFDKDYKKKRRQRMMQHPKNLPSALANAAEGFVMGVALGISGVVVNPVKGIQEEGVEGFFKGIGKGLMGLISKPAGSAIDMVSMAFDGIRRASEMGENVIVRMRPPRYIHPQLGLKPYSRYQAVGMRILNNISKGKYSNTDIYWAHAALSPDDRADVVLVTDRHLFLLGKCRMWGDWDVEMKVRLADILGVPAVTEDKLIFKVKRDDTGFSIFTSDEQEITCPDREVLLWLQKKIEAVMALGEL